MVSPIKPVALFLAILLTLPFTAIAKEENVLNSCGNAEDIILSTTFADKDSIPNPVQAENYVALGLMYHSTSGNFLPYETLSNALALRLILKSAGKSKEAEMLAYNQAERQLAGLGEYDDLSWADGYYLYALKEGLISSIEFYDAYKNPDSSLRRDEKVSVQNFIRWMAVAHGVFLDGKTIPTDVYIDPMYKVYYASLYKYGFFTLSDVEYFAPWRFITRDDVSLIFEKFETYILSALKMRTMVGTVEGINIKFDGEDYIRSVTVNSLGTEYILRSFGTNISAPFSDISGEIAVFGKGLPDITGVLRNGDKIRVYYKEDTALFIRVIEYEKKDEYKPSPLNFSGNLYVFDEAGGNVTLNCDERLKTFYLSGSLKIYNRTQEITPSDLAETGIDAECTVYADSAIRGGLHRVYSIIIN